MKSLKLDSSYKPVAIIDSREALVLCLSGRAKLVENHDKTIRSATQTFYLPSIVVIDRFVKHINYSKHCTKRNILWRDSWTCQYCNYTGPKETLTLDHIVPKSKGGPKSWNNLVTSCKPCNQRKGSKTLEEANMSLLNPIKPPAQLAFKSIKKSDILSSWHRYLKFMKR